MLQPNRNKQPSLAEMRELLNLSAKPVEPEVISVDSERAIPVILRANLSFPIASQNSEIPSRPTLSAAALKYFDQVVDSPAWKRKMSSYVSDTKTFLTKVIPENKKVLLIGCLTSDILESLRPSVGVGLDVSEKAVRLNRANSGQKNISYFHALPEDFQTEIKFDYVVILNYVDHCEDITSLVGSVRKFVHEDSRVVVSMVNPLWHSLIALASRLKIRIPDYKRNLVASRALGTSLEVKRFKMMEVSRRILIPRNIPFLSNFVNQYLAKLPLLNSLCFMQYVSAKPMPFSDTPRSGVSVIIPCYNEEGNIEECIKRVPKMGRFTEIVVVNDGSRDNTVKIVEALMPQHPNVTLITYEKNGGKGMAVWRGLRAAKGEIVMILDADMTVPPEELVEFYEALEYHAADFASGTRFLYPMEKEAMRFANYIGNILFSKLVQVIVGSECSDTLCGTKAMRKSDFSHFVLEDRAWGDFDLIFHAARMKLRCIEVPVHYKSRVAGESKMKAFNAGMKFLKLCLQKWATLP